MNDPTRRTLIDPTHMPETQKALARFRDGDVFAALECCAYYRESGIPYVLMPQEILDFLCNGAAEYAATSKPRAAPSLDRILGLPVKMKKSLGKRKREAIAEYVEAQINECIGPGGKIVKRYSRDEKGDIVRDEHGKKIRIISDKKRPTNAFLGIVAERFGVSDRPNSYATIRTIWREHRKK